jgi:outer membrane receptor protein involved in Fe transport
MKRWGLLFLFFIYAALFSQTTGKISGVVTDRESGTPLPGANVVIVGTQLGAAADVNGEFYILNVPPGSYTVEARMMGFNTTQMEGVRVFVNRTIPLDFELTSTVIEGQVVVVKADKFVMKKDQTSSIRNVSSQDIELLPAESVTQVVRMQPGVVGDHFRGGRNNEVAYLIDGVSITDAFDNTQRTSSVNPEVVEDVEVITGTFNAEYGGVMSGVVNVVTKSGNNRFSGSASANFGNYVTSNGDIFWGLDNTEFDRIQDYKGAISGPIVKDKLFFVANGRYEKNLGHLNALRYFNVDDYSNFDSQFENQWYVEHTGDSSIVPFNWGKYYSGFGKLTYLLTRSIKLSSSVTFNKGDGLGYSHSLKFNPDRQSGWHNKTLMGSLNLNHMLSKSAFYDFKMSYSDYWTGSYLYRDPLDSRYVNDNYNGSGSSYFSTGGQNKGHTIREEKKINAKLDFTWQVNKSHSIKTGFDISQINLNQEYHSIRNAYEGTGLENEYIIEGDVIFIDSTLSIIMNPERVYPFYEPKIFPNSSVHTDQYVRKPIEGSCYIQDKMEFDMMVVNMGVRLDYFDPQTVYPSNYRNPGNQTDLDNPDRLSTYIDTDPQYQISPRLGLSYSLGNTALLRFAYGHFLQLPPMNFYYQNSAFVIGATDYGTRMGNAQLKPQKTIQYEVGLFQQLSSDMNIEVAVWYKDIYDLVTAKVYTTYNQRRYGIYTNKEYGNARGLEIKYDFRMNNLIAGANYTLSYTKGVADNPNTTFDRAGNEQDPVNKLIPMSWDQRHTFNLSFGYNTRKYGVTALLYYNSGQPYTWSPIPQSPLRAINLFPNNQYRPTRTSVDLNAYYNFATFKGVQMKLTLLVYNLFDTLNENSVSGETGRAYTAIVQETDLSGYRSTFSTFEDTYQNPSMYAAPRQVKLGLGVAF